MADDSRTPTGAEEGGQPPGGIPGLAQDIDDMWQLLVRERDEARARVAALERQLARRASAACRHVPSVDLERFEVDPAFLEIIPAETARRFWVLPLRVSRVFTVAMADPSNQAAIDEIGARTGFLVQPVTASESAPEDALHHSYGPPGSTGGSTPPRARGHLRLAWSRGDSPREEPGGGPGGGRSAA